MHDCVAAVAIAVAAAYRRRKQRIKTTAQWVFVLGLLDDKRCNHVPGHGQHICSLYNMRRAAVTTAAWPRTWTSIVWG